MTEIISGQATGAALADEDAQLVRAAQRNPAEFRALYQKWLPALYRYFYFRVGNPKDAEDLTAQLFLKVYEDLPRYHERGRFSAWLFTQAHHRAVDFYRRKKDVVTLEQVDNLILAENLAPDPLGQAEQRADVRQLLALLRTLPEDDQELIRLRFVADLSYREIGDVLHRREDAVRKAIVRLMERLHRQMEDLNERE